MKNFFLFLIFVSFSAFADRDDDCRGDPHHCNGGGGDDPPIEVEAEADADASATADAESHSESSSESSSDSSSEASGTQNVNIDARSPGRSFIGGGDSTADDQKVFAVGGGWLTGNASIRFDLTDKEARALRIASQWHADGLIKQSYRMQCSLKIVYKPFGNPDKCFTTLSPPKPEPTGNVVLTEDEYHGLLLAQVQQEEFEEQQQMVEDKFAQYDNLIKEREVEHEADDAEIERLKRQLAEEDARRAVVRERYAKKAEEEANEPDSQ